MLENLDIWKILTRKKKKLNYKEASMGLICCTEALFVYKLNLKHSFIKNVLHP